MPTIHRLHRLIALALVGFGLLGAVPGAASLVDLEAALDADHVVPGSSRRAYLRVALTGSDRPGASARPTVNLAIVLDKSGSMAGEKIQQAREAAIMAIDRLGPDDIVSVVTYDSTVQVLVPATRIRDRGALARTIRAVTAGGNTALFAGVAKGAAELEKFNDDRLVSRLVLLSDGIANVGPSSPGALADLGASLGRDGIAVTTIGLGDGYHEELMSRLARASDGNHYFAQEAADLAGIYDFELGEILAVIAQEVEIEIHCRPGLRPVRILGRDAVLDGRTIRASLNQLYRRQTKYILVEVEVDLPGSVSGPQALADVSVSYRELDAREPSALDSRVMVWPAATEAEVAASRNPRVMGSVARQLGAERNRLAMELRDEGRQEEARRILLENATFLEDQAARLGNEWLAKDASRARTSAENLDDEEWKAQRKQVEADLFEQVQALGYVE